MSSGDRPSLDSFGEASRPFVAALRGNDPGAREAALEEIAPVVDDALARELLRFARDPGGTPAERGRALIVLGPALEETSYDEDEEGRLASALGSEEWWDTPLSEAAYREVQEALRRIYHDGGQPREVRRRALEAAVRAPRSWHRDAVATAWRSGDPEWRLTAVFAMGFLGGFEDEIEEAFRGDDAVLRREAIRAAGEAGLEHLAQELLAVAADAGADSDDRVAALEALGALQQVDAWDEIEDLTDDDDPEVAEAAEAALDELRTWTPLEESPFDLDDELDLADLDEVDWEDGDYEG